MPANFYWEISNLSPQTITQLGTTGNLMNFQNADTSNPNTFNTNPVTAGSNSFEVYLSASISGSFSAVQNFQFWQNSGSLGPGINILWGDTSNYHVPTTSVSTIATYAIPASNPGTTNVGIGGNLAGVLTNPGTSDYIVMQAQTTGSAGPGESTAVSFSISYDEN